MHEGYELKILKACRHHITHLLSSEVSHFFPGPFVQIQVVVALITGNNELFDCCLGAYGPGQFKVVCTCAVHYNM